ncbi:hypothetical protein FN846DRAFT_895631 [Sphaerosporella brunnea]|uniref:Uncharacterized protein n=1 Tax=Sphaerosporella brunnea TaxID=1250544 RepID=A0A5J5EEK6_9PEZI|nr:hypothetical protein FN846DRAFT_895631 [Sphaerosporella brunnea]
MAAPPPMTINLDTCVAELSLIDDDFQNIRYTVPQFSEEHANIVLPVILGTDSSVLTRDMEGPVDKELYVASIVTDLNTFNEQYLQTLISKADAAPGSDNAQHRQAMGMITTTFAILQTKARNALEQYMALLDNFRMVDRFIESTRANLARNMPVLQLAANNAIQAHPEAYREELRTLREQIRQLRPEPGARSIIETLRANVKTLEVRNAALRIQLESKNKRLNAITDDSGGLPPGESETNKQRQAELEVENRELKKEVGKMKKQVADAKKAASKSGSVAGQPGDCGAYIDALNQLMANNARPFTLDYPDQWFANQWHALYQRIGKWCWAGYRRVGLPRQEAPVHGDLPDNYFENLHNSPMDPLMAIYSRDIAVRGSDMIALWNCGDPDYRWYICMGLVYRILHEEIFEAIRNFLTTEMPNPVGDWLDKEQAIGGFLTDTPGKSSLATGMFTRGTSSFRKRKYNEIMNLCCDRAPPLYDGHLGAPLDFDPLGASETDLQILEFFSAQAPKEREKRRKRKFDIFKAMENRSEAEIQLRIFHTNRAKMMKSIFTLIDDPIRGETRTWRSGVVNLIFDTLEPARITPEVAASNGLQDTQWVARKALKRELWAIVKMAFDLAVTMRCQRPSYYTRMPPPIADYDYDTSWMHHLGAEKGLDDPAVQAIEARARALPLPYNVMPIGKVRLAVCPALCKRGDNGDYTARSERTLVPLGVFAFVGNLEQMERWAQEFRLEHWEETCARVAREYKAAQEREEAFRAAQRAAPGWNPTKDNMVDEGAKDLRDLVPERMRMSDEKLRVLKRQRLEDERARRARAEAGLEEDDDNGDNGGGDGGDGGGGDGDGDGGGGDGGEQ